MNLKPDLTKPAYLYVAGGMTFLVIALFAVLGTMKDIQLNKAATQIQVEQWKLKATQQKSYADCMQSRLSINKSIHDITPDSVKCKGFILNK